jgi:hypothetical protein
LWTRLKGAPEFTRILFMFQVGSNRRRYPTYYRQTLWLAG